MHTCTPSAVLLAGIALLFVGYVPDRGFAQVMPLRSGLVGGMFAPRMSGGFSAPSYGGASYGNPLSSGYGGASMSSYGSSPYGSGEPGYSIPDPYSGYLKGSADVIKSQGQSLMTTQSAYLLNENVTSARIDNRRRGFEEWLWERANLPTLNDQREREQTLQVRRSLNDPPLTEIWSGKSLNDLLTLSQQRRTQGISLVDVTLANDVAKNINVTSSRSGASLGLLGPDGKLTWPLALEEWTGAGEGRTLRLELEALVKKAYADAGQERADPGTLKEIDRITARLRAILAKQSSEASFGQYTEGKRFLNQLDDAMKILRQPDARAYLNGQYALTGSTAAEVVAHMSRYGLRFAPATPGQESAYLALHRALAAYNGNTGVDSNRPR